MEVLIHIGLSLLYLIEDLLNILGEALVVFDF